MHPVVSIRAATAADLAEVCKIAEDLATLHHTARPAVFAPASGTTRDEEHWRESILGEGRMAFVASVGGDVVGFITLACRTESHSLLQPARIAQVYSVCVVERMRGKGVGRLLMQKAESWAEDQGASELRLVVWAFNEAATRMYEELGYEVLSHTMGKVLGQGE